MSKHTAGPLLCRGAVSHHFGRNGSAYGPYFPTLLRDNHRHGGKTKQNNKGKNHTSHTTRARFILSFTDEGYEKHLASCAFFEHPIGFIQSSSTLLEVILLVIFGIVSITSFTCCKSAFDALFPVLKIDIHILSQQQSRAATNMLT